MKRWAILALLGLLATAALAADNATLITPCGTGCVTVRAKDIGLGVQSPVYILGDTSGNPIYGIAGTANANVLTVQGIAAMTPLLVNGSGVTQPVSGTVTANAGTGTFTVGGTVAATQSGTWTVQQGTPPWQVNGNVASAATDSGNPEKVGGVFNTTQPTVTTGQRVDAQSTARGALIVATGVDSVTVGGTVTANAGTGTFTVGGTVTANAGTGNFAENLAQVAGSTVSTAATGVQKVGVVGNAGAAMDAAGQNAASPANELLTGCQFNTTPTTITSGNISPTQCDNGGKLLVNTGTVTVTGTVTANQGGAPWQENVTQFNGTAATAKASGTNAATTDTALVVAPSPNPSDVCTSIKPISQTASTDLITSTNKLHICAILIVSATAQSVSLVEGTVTTCGTGTAALMGATTAANGMALAANGGFAHTAERPFMVTQTTADHLCLLQSGAGNVSGFISYVDHN